VQIRPCISLHDISFLLSPICCFLKFFLVSQLLAFVGSSMFFSFCDPVSSKSGNKFLVLLWVHWIQGFFPSLSLPPPPPSESIFNKAQFRRNSNTLSDHFKIFVTSEQNWGINMRSYKIYILVIL
jgi:hypothetical protein